MYVIMIVYLMICAVVSIPFCDLCYTAQGLAYLKGAGNVMLSLLRNVICVQATWFCPCDSNVLEVSKFSMCSVLLMVETV